jgi:Winged helix DNA-binding domain
MPIRNSTIHGAHKPSAPLLSKRALNRALLARQLLLCRSDDTVLAALTHLVSLQAQTPNAPYLSLWSRLKGFDPNQLTAFIHARRVVRIALMRGTIHSVTDSDCLELRPHFDRVLDRGLRGAFGKHLEGLNLKQVEAAASRLLKKQPLTFDELGKLLARRWPESRTSCARQCRKGAASADPDPAARNLGRRRPRRACASGDLAGKAPLRCSDLGADDGSLSRGLWPGQRSRCASLVGAYGLRLVLESMRPSLIAFMDEARNELFDLPDAPRPDADTPAPPRFLLVFDNVLLSHADRGRILSETHRKMLFGTAALLEGSLLVDSFVGAKWKIVHESGHAVLIVQPFAVLNKRDRAAISDEGAELLKFALPTAEI